MKVRILLSILPFFFFFSCVVISLEAKKAVYEDSKNQFLEILKKNYHSKKSMISLRKQLLQGRKKHLVPALLEVMKDSSYPDRNRWLAIFLVGQVLGVKAKNLLGKYLLHPQWFMRLAALKVLRRLKVGDKMSIASYKKLLHDDSYLVKYQVLELIHDLKLTALRPKILEYLSKANKSFSAKDDDLEGKFLKKMMLIVADLKVGGSK